MASRRKSWKEVGSAVGGVPPTFCCVGDCIRAIRRVAAVMHARRHCLRLPFTAICVQEKRCNVIGMLFFVGNGSCVRKWEVAVVWGKQKRKEFDHKWMTLEAQPLQLGQNKSQEPYRKIRVFDVDLS
jgi:hypothetical protein